MTPLEEKLVREFAGPPAPATLKARQMIGRDSTAEIAARPDFLRDMAPMLVAGLLDIVSTEGMMKSGYNETNPLLPKTSGSVAPAMALGTLLQALAYHQITKKNPKLGDVLKTQQTATSGTLAGQNFSLVGKDPYTSDDRLSVWKK